MRNRRFAQPVLFILLLTGLLLIGGVGPVAAEDSGGHVRHDLNSLDQGLDRQINLYALDNVPRLVRKTVFRAVTLGKRGEHERVVELLTEHLQDHPDQDHYLVRLYLGQAYGNLEQFDEAAVHYRRAADLEPRLDRAWIGLGDVCYRRNRYDEAAEAFEKGFYSSPDRPVSVLYSAAAAALQAGRSQKALDLFLELESGRWGDAKLDWYRGLAAAAVSAEQPEAAEPALTRLLTRYPDKADAWYLVYQFAVSGQDYRRAAVALTVTGYLRTLTDEEGDQLGDLYQLVGTPALSVAAYEESLPEDPEPEQYEKLVSACLAAHHVDHALETLEVALAHEETPRLLSLLGDVHYQRKDYGAAREAFARLLEIDPDYSRAYLMVGYCSVELGEKDAALDNLGRVAQDPEHGAIAQLLIQRAMRMPDETL